MCLLCCDEAGRFEGLMDPRRRKDDERERSRRRRSRVTSVERRSNRAKENTEPKSVSTVQSAPGTPLLPLRAQDISIPSVSPYPKDSLPFEKRCQKGSRVKTKRSAVGSIESALQRAFRAPLQFSGLLFHSPTATICNLPGFRLGTPKTGKRGARTLEVGALH